MSQERLTVALAEYQALRNEIVLKPADDLSDIYNILFCSWAILRVYFCQKDSRFNPRSSFCRAGLILTIAL